MAVVTIEGIFMGANLHQTKWEGQERTSVLVDIYQPNSTLKSKSLQVKAEDLAYLAQFNQNYTVGEPIVLKCTVTAYKNDPTYKLVDIAA